jgi:hypothetical protein
MDLSVMPRVMWTRRRLTRCRRLTCLLAGLGLLAGVARAQGIMDTTCTAAGPEPATMESDGCVGVNFYDSLEAVADSPAVSSRASGYQPKPPSFVRAFAGLAVANLAAVGINNLARDLESTSPTSWWRNLQGGWNWDNNNISTNNIEHPYGGAVYYNIGRVNGFSFWGSAPITLAGSLMWELFGEPTSPAKNDLITTTLGGISLGETVLRLSDLILDDEAHGVNRVWREASVVLLNPGLGLTRIARGEAWRQGANPPRLRPDSLRTFVTTGARRQTMPAKSLDPQKDEAFGSFGMQYGDPFRAGKTEPFSSFDFAAAFSTGEVTVTEVATRGILTSLGRHPGRTARVDGVFMDLEFQWNEAYMFGVQSFGLGTMSRTGNGEGWRLVTDVSVELAPLVASTDPYADWVVDREYDYGAGLGGRLMAQLDYRGYRVLSAGYRNFWTATLNGASDTKLIQFATVEARVPLAFGVSAGGSYSLYAQRSTYHTRNSGHETLPSYTLFVSTGR